MQARSIGTAAAPEPLVTLVRTGTGYAGRVTIPGTTPVLWIEVRGPGEHRISRGAPEPGQDLRSLDFVLPPDFAGALVSSVGYAGGTVSRRVTNL